MLEDPPIYYMSASALDKTIIMPKKKIVLYKYKSFRVKLILFLYLK